MPYTSIPSAEQMFKATVSAVTGGYKQKHRRPRAPTTDRPVRMNRKPVARLPVAHACFIHDVENLDRLSCGLVDRGRVCYLVHFCKK